MLLLLDKTDWSTCVVHAFNKANCSADMLAGMGHFGGFHWTVLDVPPPQLLLALSDDARGASFPRIVS